MSWTTNGYTPDDFNVIIDKYYNATISEFGSVSKERWTGSKTYEVCYSSAQIDMQYQSVFAEIFSKIALWMQDVNFKINAPATTAIAMQQQFLEKFGLRIGIKPMIEADRGLINIAIDYTPEQDLNYQIGDFLRKNCIAGGIVMVGDIKVDIPVGGQSFESVWVKAVERQVSFKLTITVSRQSINYLESELDIQKRFIANFKAMQEIGYDIEPEKYFEIVRDAPYASDILTQFSLDSGSTWQTLPHASLYSDKWVCELNTNNITIVRP